MLKITPILLLIFQMNLQAQDLNGDYGGTWEGNWFNTTFGSTGPIYMEIYINESNMTYMTYSDIGGNVFGGFDPPPTQGQGSFTNNTGVLSIVTQGPILGDVTLNLDTNTGEVSVEAVPGGAIATFSITGTATPQVMDLEYSLAFAGGGGAIGTIDLTKTSPVTPFLDIEGETSLLKDFSLKQNFPNPFNPSTKIYFSLPNESTVTITIYNILGKEINKLISQLKPQGNHSVEWDGKDNFRNPVSAGVYLYQMQAGDFVKTKKMLLMK